MNLKTKLAVAGVAALAAAGTGAALAAVGGSGSSLRATPGVRGAAAAWGERAPGPGFRLGVGLQAAADYLGVSLATLRSDLQSGKTLAQVADGTSGKSAQGLVDSLVAKAKASLDKAVAAGKLKQAQEDAIVSNLQQRVTAMVNATHPASPRPFGGRGFGFGPGFRLGVGLQAAADYLGVSLATLRSDLQSGKTLAQVADGTSGKSAQGLVDSLVAKAKASLDKAVAAGKLKQAQEDAIVSNLQQRVTAMVNATHPASPRPFGGRGFGGRGFSHGFGFGGGRRGWAPPSGSTTA